MQTWGNEGFLPRQVIIDGYGGGGFQFAGMSHRGSILALPSGIRAWGVGNMASLDAASIAPVFDEQRDAMELLLVGTGDALRPLPAAVRDVLRRRGLRFDMMATGHAVSTYNILLGERRKVAAALIASP